MSMIELTKARLESGLSRNGGYNSRQIVALGEDMRDRGWRKRLLHSYVKKEDFEKFLALKDASKHSNYKQMRLF